jgi:hypothetical protein
MGFRMGKWTARIFPTSFGRCGRSAAAIGSPTSRVGCCDSWGLGEMRLGDDGWCCISGARDRPSQDSPPLVGASGCISFPRLHHARSALGDIVYFKVGEMGSTAIA